MSESIAPPTTSPTISGRNLSRTRFTKPPIERAIATSVLRRGGARWRARGCGHHAHADALRTRASRALDADVSDHCASGLVLGLREVREQAVDLVLRLHLVLERHGRELSVLWRERAVVLRELLRAAAEERE